ncbi:CCAAT/enhancer-binding protein zeta-like [Tropilaelaps mercedesae]|uniref:CCAAT/enhancer-binding protein zeta-like n=1 Tax=Tropilaelaps mercedesae TaxID=418985 RepID=A0A1V9X6D3_9ACAR|nr:CCAAT/enhancer-binding protein zeta-like [Tropilaelaps mercedesae]
MKSKKGEFDVNKLTVSADRFQSMLDNNRGFDSTGALYAFSAKTAAGKVSDTKQLDWERKRHFQLFGKRKPKDRVYKKGKVAKKTSATKAKKKRYQISRL